MPDSNTEDPKWSEKKMEGDQHAVRTVECLRGRLLAERTASRAAEENADLMAKKLGELEEKLKVEVKARKKAEKKLSLLIEKVESLSISYNLEDSAELSLSSSSENFESFCISSADHGEGHRFQSSDSCVEGHERPYVGIPFGQKLELRMVPENSMVQRGNPCGETLKLEEECGDYGISSLSTEEPSHHGLELCDKLTDSDAFDSGMNNSMVQEMEKREENSDNCEDGFINRSMAVVPLTMLDAGSEGSTMMEVKITNQTVTEVLDSLRQIRERLQNSIETRHMIKVG